MRVAVDLSIFLEHNSLLILLAFLIVILRETFRLLGL